MNLLAEFEENKRQYENGEINEAKFHERKTSILNKWSGKETKKETKKVVLSRVNNKPKEKDLYRILQLEPNATEAEIRSNYKKLALKHHPDKNDGIVTEEWEKLSKAYEILSDENSRSLYDTYGKIDESLAGKASFNLYVGGDLWKPYIGNLEIGLWMFSFTNNAEPELAEQKERRHAIRVSNIVRYLQDKLSRFPKQDNSLEFKSFKESLYQEARKLCTEPNGKEVLSLLGEVYISEAQSMPNKHSEFLKNIWFMVDLISGYLAIKAKKNKPNLEEIGKITWKLSRTEISSIAHETCEQLLNNKSCSENERGHISNSLHLLGEVWLEVSKSI